MSMPGSNVAKDRDAVAGASLGGPRREEVPALTGLRFIAAFPFWARMVFGSF